MHDERLQAVSHRAGFVAYFVTTSLVIIASCVFVFAFDDARAAAILIGIFIVGSLTYLLIVARNGLIAAQREVWADASPAVRARIVVGNLLGTITFGALMFLFDYLLGDKSLRSAALSATATALLWGTTMFFIFAYARRRKS
jgi:hypothetical protein